VDIREILSDTCSNGEDRQSASWGRLTTLEARFPAAPKKLKFLLRAAGEWPISISRHRNNDHSAEAAKRRIISEKQHADRLDAATNGRRATKEDHDAA
jgi:hypothetical protein